MVPLSGQQPDHAAARGARAADDLRDRRKRRARRRARHGIVARELRQDAGAVPVDPSRVHQRGRQRLRGRRRSRRPYPGARLQRRATVDACFRAGQPGGVFDAVESAYRTLIGSVAAARTDVTVLVHNYDYAIPDGRTLPGMRSWLKLPMDNDRVPHAGAPRDGLRREIVRALIDELTVRLSDLETALNAPGKTADRSRVVGRHARRRRMGERAASEIRGVRAARRRLLERTRAAGARAAMKRTLLVTLAAVHGRCGARASERRGAGSEGHGADRIPRPAGPQRVPAARARAKRTLDPLRRPSRRHRRRTKPLNPVTGAREFNGTSILDVTDPRAPRYLAHIPGEAGLGEAGGAQMVRVCAGRSCRTATRPSSTCCDRSATRRTKSGT